MDILHHVEQFQANGTDTLRSALFSAPRGREKRQYAERIDNMYTPSETRHRTQSDP